MSWNFFTDNLPLWMVNALCFASLIFIFFHFVERKIIHSARKIIDISLKITHYMEQVIKHEDESNRELNEVIRKTKELQSKVFFVRPQIEALRDHLQNSEDSNEPKSMILLSKVYHAQFLERLLFEDMLDIVKECVDYAKKQNDFNKPRNDKFKAFLKEFHSK